MWATSGYRGWALVLAVTRFITTRRKPVIKLVGIK
jgi:hypothetical protein